MIMRMRSIKTGLLCLLVKDHVFDSPFSLFIVSRIRNKDNEQRRITQYEDINGRRTRSTLSLTHSMPGYYSMDVRYTGQPHRAHGQTLTGKVNPNLIYNDYDEIASVSQMGTSRRYEKLKTPVSRPGKPLGYYETMPVSRSERTEEYYDTIPEPRSSRKEIVYDVI